ncbi:hypothetical protein YC2023_096195 [Brassica napus]
MMLLPLDTNLQTSRQTPFSWTKKTPEITTIVGLFPFREGMQQRETYLASLWITVDDLLNGVEAAYQASGKGINRIRNASTFMKNYAKEMKVHRFPRSDDASNHEDFESFHEKLCKGNESPPPS